MEVKEVLFLLLAVVPPSMAIGAWAQKIICYLEEIRQNKTSN